MVLVLFPLRSVNVREKNLVTRSCVISGASISIIIHMSRFMRKVLLNFTWCRPFGQVNNVKIPRNISLTSVSCFFFIALSEF